LLGPIPVVGVELQAQFGDAVTQFGVLGREGVFIDLVHQPEVEQAVLLITQRRELAVEKQVP